jgi:hypothetical protein
MTRAPGALEDQRRYEQISAQATWYPQVLQIPCIGCISLSLLPAITMPKFPPHIGQVRAKYLIML